MGTNPDTDIIILEGIVEYIFREGRIPYDDELEDFINNRLKINLPVSAYMERVKRLKRTYREQVGKTDKGLALQDPRNEKLFDLADVIWNSEDFSESEDGIEEEQRCFSGSKCDDLNALLPIMFKNTVKESPESVLRSLMLQSPVPMSDDLHATFRNIVKEGPACILRSVMVEDAVPLSVLPPLRPSMENFQTAVASNEEKISRESL